MSILKLFSLILGSALFFPVSCTTALFVGIEINSYLFARDMSRGDKPYNPFYVLATVPTENISPIEFLEVGEYIQKTPEVSFLLAQPSGALPGKSFSWRVISSNSYEQLVEVQYKDGDTGFINRYRAMRHLVSPVSSRMWYHGYMFVSLPFAIGFGLLVYWLGRYLRRKYVVRISERVKKWVTALVIICILGFVAIPQYVAYRKSRIKQDQATLDFNKTLKINPRDAKAYFNRGNAYDDKGQYDQAISDFNKVLEIDPKFENAYINRGNAYANKGQYDQAISDYTKALEIDPRGADTYRNRGLTYAKKGQYNLAISDYTKALEINPMYTRVYINRGEAYYLEREYEKSWKDVEKAKYLGYPIDPEFLDDLRKASGRKN
jgi:tetratricopeptide (TPR) repeat protein